MSVSKPTPARRTAAPRGPSRLRIAAIWFALLLCSFLFGMLIVYPLLGYLFAGTEEDKKPPASPAGRPTSRPSTSLHAPPPNRTELRVENRTARREPAPGISLTPDDSVVEAADSVTPTPISESNTTNPPAPPESATSSTGPPPSPGPGAEAKPAPAPALSGDIPPSERPEPNPESTPASPGGARSVRSEG